MSEVNRYRPRGDRRIVAYYDDSGLYYCANPLVEQRPGDTEAWRRALETIIDVHASAGVDTIAQVVFARFTHMLQPDVTSAAVPAYAQRPEDDDHVRNAVRGVRLVKALHEAGMDLQQILIDRAHRHGMEVMAALRMNDRHPIALKERVYVENPQWHLKLGCDGVYHDGGFDYSIEAVRERLLQFIADALEHYDFDGVEYDWIRWVYVFRPGTERDNAPLLTDFHRRTRQLLDEASKRRGRRLRLGVRVPHVLERCMEAGYDIAPWIREGLVDYVVPTHFGHMDYNTRVEDFRELTEGTDCRVYPSTQGIKWTGPCRLDEYAPSHFYAIARSFYAFGADGIETYNYQFPTFELQRAKVHQLTPLRDPERLAARDRDYLYWHHHGPLQATGAQAMRYDVIRLERGGTAASGGFGFRLPEDPGNNGLLAVLKFKAVGLDSSDVLDVKLNGSVVPPNAIERAHVWDGKDADGKDEPYDVFRLPLGTVPVRYGDNELTVGLAQSSGGPGEIRIEEVEVNVRPA